MEQSVHFIRPDFKDAATADRDTDIFVIQHILSGEAFHITSGPHAGKYTLKENALCKYHYVPETTLEPSDIKASEFLTALTQRHISIESTKLEGTATANPLKETPFLNALRHDTSFHINKNGLTNNYIATISLGSIPAGQWDIKEAKLTIGTNKLGAIAQEQSTLSAFDMLNAIRRKQFQYGVEKTPIYQHYSKGYPA